MDEITREEFEKAKNTIRAYYNRDFKQENEHNRACICCGNINIKPLHADTIRFPEQGAYMYGIVDKISSGYGSKHDGNMYIIAICDNCIDKLSEEGKIQYAGNYMNVY